MEDIQKKLENFEQSCYKLANQERNTLEEKINLKIKDSVEKELGEYKKKLEKKKKNAFNKMEKEFNSKLWEIENDCKKRLIEKEKEFENEIYSNLCEEMKQFTYKEEYLEFFINCISSSIGKLINKNDIVICVTQKDKDRFFNEINNFSYNIQIIDDSFIGGCILKNENEIIDNTILTNLKEKIHERENNS